MTTELHRLKEGDQIIIDNKIFIGSGDYVGIVQPDGKLVVKHAHEWSVDTLASVIHVMRLQMILDHQIKTTAAKQIKELQEQNSRLESRVNRLQTELYATIDDGK